MASAIGTSSAAPKAVPMARKLAYRNLFHDQLSLFVTLVGIVFSVVLVAVQCSIYLGSEFRMVLAQGVIYFLRDVLPIVMTFNLVWGLLILTIAMCVLAAVSAMFKVIRIDPAVVFSR